MRTTNYLLGVIALLLLAIVVQLYLSPFETTGVSNVRVIDGSVSVAGSVTVDGSVSIDNTVDVEVQNTVDVDVSEPLGVTVW